MIAGRAEGQGSGERAAGSRLGAGFRRRATTGQPGQAERSGTGHDLAAVEKITFRGHIAFGQLPALGLFDQHRIPRLLALSPFESSAVFVKRTPGARLRDRG